MTNHANRFVTRSRHAVSRFRHGADYETTMNLLAEHANRVSRLNPRIVTNVAQAAALEEIYHLMEWVQSREPAHVVPNHFDSLTDLGDGNYATPQRHVEY